MENGNLVKFQEGLYEDEKNMVYKVLEVNGDRCIIEAQIENMPIKPTSVAMVAELVVL